MLHFRFRNLQLDFTALVLHFWETAAVFHYPSGSDSFGVCCLLGQLGIWFLLKRKTLANDSIYRMLSLFLYYAIFISTWPFLSVCAILPFYLKIKLYFLCSCDTLFLKEPSPRPFWTLSHWCLLGTFVAGARLFFYFAVSFFCNRDGFRYVFYETDGLFGIDMLCLTVYCFSFT